MTIYHDDLDLQDGEELYMDEFGERIDNDAVSDHTFLARAKNARRHQVQDVLLCADENRVPGIVAALSADHDVRILRQYIDNLALAFIAPLGAH